MNSWKPVDDLEEPDAHDRMLASDMDDNRPLYEGDARLDATATIIVPRDGKGPSASDAA